LSDAELVKGILAGDAAAREQMAKLYYPRLHATACHFMGWKDSEAEDLVQETFVQALEGLAGFEGRSSLYTWLNHICVNLCFARLRGRKRQLATASDDLEALLAPRGLAGAADAAAEELKAARLATLERLLSGMEKRCTQMLAYRFKEGLALNEIKERLKLPMGTVASRLRRCIEGLRKLAPKE
jgi:RNA polymerase sigma-70 factor (ECF subfamily)